MQCRAAVSGRVLLGRARLGQICGGIEGEEDGDEEDEDDEEEGGGGGEEEEEGK